MIIGSSTIYPSFIKKLNKRLAHAIQTARNTYLPRHFFKQREECSIFFGRFKNHRIAEARHITRRRHPRFRFANIKQEVHTTQYITIFLKKGRKAQKKEAPKLWCFFLGKAKFALPLTYKIEFFIFYARHVSFPITLHESDV